MLASLSRLAPVLLRHIDAYGEVAAEDAKDAASSLSASLHLGAAAFGAALVATLMLCVWIVMLTWDQPWRGWVPFGLAALFALGAYGCLRAMRRRQPGAATLFARLRGEWRRDRDLMERALRKPTANPDDEEEYRNEQHRSAA